MTDLYMRILLSAQQGNTMSVVNSVAKALGSGGLGGALLGVGIAAAGLAVGIGVTAVKAAGDYQQSLTQLVTGAGELRSNLGMVSDGILQLSVDTATSTKQLTDGMYMIESAGYHGASGLNVLKVAAQGAKVGNADLGNVADALTTILTDYHLSANQATGAMNALTTTVASGKTHLQDLARSMGAVLPLASSLGISFPQVAGGLAVMTNAGKDARVSAQNLANAIRSLATPNATAVKAMKEVGLTAQQLKDTLSTQGLAGTIQLVEDHVGKKFPAGSVDAVDAFKKIMGGATGFNVALMLGGKNMQSFKDNIAAISKAMQSGTGDVQGWSDIQQDFNFKLDQAQQAVNVLMIKLGTALLPILSQLMDQVTPLIVQFTDWIEKNHVLEKAVNDVKVAIGVAKTIISDTVSVVQTIHQWFVTWHDTIQNVGIALAVYFTPALIKAGVEATISGTKIAAGFIVSLVQTGTASVVNAAKVTGSFIASMVTSGAQAWIQGPKVVAGFVASLIATGTQSVVSAAKIVGSFVASLIVTGVRAAVTGGIMMASLIPAIIAVAAQSLIAAATAIPGLIIGFIGWAAAAGSAAVATIAATWPILLIAAIIAAVVVGIILAIQHWAQITQWFSSVWQAVWSAVSSFFVGLWKNIVDGVSHGLDAIGKAIQAAGGWLYSIFIQPFVNAWSTVSGIFGDIGAGISALSHGDIVGALHDFHVPGFASGIENFSGGLAYVHRGEVLANLAPGTSVIPANRVNFGGGGHTSIFYISLATMARNQSEVSRLVDMLEQELARRVRTTTPGYNTGGIF